MKEFIILKLINLGENGYFIPLKGNLDNNLEDAKDTIEIMHGKIISRLTFDLYKKSGVRNILVINKIAKSDILELRTYDKIIKKPLVKKNKLS